MASKGKEIRGFGWRNGRRPQYGDGGGWGRSEAWGENEEYCLYTPRALMTRSQPHNPVRMGVMGRAHGGPVRTVHPVHTGSSESFDPFDREGRGWM